LAPWRLCAKLGRFFSDQTGYPLAGGGACLKINEMRFSAYCLDHRLMTTGQTGQAAK